MTQKALLQSAGDGTVVPAGYVGEVRTANPAIVVNFGATAAVTNVTSITLNPGLYMLTGMVRINISGTAVAYFAGISTSVNSFDSLSHISGASATISGATYIPTTTRIVNIPTVTTYYINGSINYSVAPTGGYQTDSFIQAIRIA